jgi:hypothetical protein
VFSRDRVLATFPYFICSLKKRAQQCQECQHNTLCILWFSLRTFSRFSSTFRPITGKIEWIFAWCIYLRLRMVFFCWIFITSEFLSLYSMLRNRTNCIGNMDWNSCILLTISYDMQVVDFVVKYITNPSLCPSLLSVTILLILQCLVAHQFYNLKVTDRILRTFTTYNRAIYHRPRCCTQLPVSTRNLDTEFSLTVLRISTVRPQTVVIPFWWMETETAPETSSPHFSTLKDGFSPTPNKQKYWT